MTRGGFGASEIAAAHLLSLARPLWAGNIQSRGYCSFHSRCKPALVLLLLSTLAGGHLERSAVVSLLSELCLGVFKL